MSVPYSYCLRTDTISDELGQAYSVYGVEAISHQGEVLQSFPDIFFNLEKAKSFVELCNNEDLELIHFADVIENVLVEQYSAPSC